MEEVEDDDIEPRENDENNDISGSQFLNYLFQIQHEQQITLKDLIQQNAIKKIENSSKKNLQNAANIIQNNYNISLSIPSITNDNIIARTHSTPPRSSHRNSTRSIHSTPETPHNIYKKVSIVSVREQKILSFINFIYYIFWSVFSIVNSILFVINNTVPDSIPPMYFELYSALSSYLNIAYPIFLGKLKDFLRDEYNPSVTESNSRVT